jgi:hypothetical protein
MKKKSKTSGAIEEAHRRFLEEYGDKNGKVDWEKVHANSTPIPREEMFARANAQARKSKKMVTRTKLHKFA